MWQSSVPIFRLIDDDGRESGTDSLWQKQEMVVAVLDNNGCTACREVEQALRDADDAGEWSREHAGLVVLPLTDSDSVARITDRMFEELAPLGVERGAPTVAIADRFGHIYAAIDVHGTEPAQVLRETHAWIDFAQEQCDECGVPVQTATEAPLADSADD